MRFASFLLTITFLLAGCAAPASRWREDAFSRFNSAVSAGSQQFAPEETDNIRQTLALADRYAAQRLTEDAERLFRLSCQKSQLLYRNLVLSKVRQGATLAVQNDEAKPPEVIALAAEPISMKAAFEQALREQEQEKQTPQAVLEKNEVPIAAAVVQPVEQVSVALPDTPKSGISTLPPADVSPARVATESTTDDAKELVKPSADAGASGVDTVLMTEPVLIKATGDKPDPEAVTNKIADMAVLPALSGSGANVSTAAPETTTVLNGTGAPGGDPALMTGPAVKSEALPDVSMPVVEKTGRRSKVAHAGRSGMPEEVLTPPRGFERTPPGQAMTKRPPKPSAMPRHGDPGNTTIYLTFDDGPSRLTLPIAGFLKNQGVAATFFALGSNIKGHEQVIRDTVALGHRVGNHTLSHNLKKLNGSLHQSTNEIEKTAAMVEKLGGDGKMVRIPYGASNRALATSVAAEGGQIFDWDINSLDSSKRGAKDSALIERTVLQQLQKSGKRHIVLLFHDGAGHEATLTAIRRLVPRLKQEGYRFGLLSRSDRVARARQVSVATP